MPLHDLAQLGGWEGVHDIWIVELLRNIQSQLPPEYRAHIGSNPVLGIGADFEKPDVSVRQWEGQSPSTHSDPGLALEEPDEEVAVLALEPQKAVYVIRKGRLIAAVELISPRNKDRPSARAVYATRYRNYLQEGANLAIVDLHAEPLGFSFADQMDKDLALK